LATRVRTSSIEKHSSVSCRSGVELPMFMIEPPDAVHARNSVQINASGSVTPIQKSWSAAFRPQRFCFEAVRKLGGTGDASSTHERLCGDFEPSIYARNAAQQMMPALGLRISRTVFSALRYQLARLSHRCTSAEPREPRITSDRTRDWLKSKNPSTKCKSVGPKRLKETVAHSRNFWPGDPHSN
jgi:hypothetical protein